MKDYTEVKVRGSRECDFCGAPAEYDGKTIVGPWAYMCGTHFRLFGVGLGLGRGQKLIYEREEDE